MEHLIIGWFWFGVAAIVVLAVAAFASLLLLAAYFEKRRLIPLAPANSEALGEKSDKAAKYLTPAIGLGFRDLGLFQDREGSLKTYVSLLLSADEQVAILIAHGRMARFKLISKLSDGRLLVTVQDGGEPDLSGLREESRRHGSIEELVAFHNDQLLKFPAVKFDVERIIPDLAIHERTCAKRLIEMGYARWRYVDESTWSYTLRGSVKIAFESLRTIRETVQMAKAAQSKSTILP